MSLNNAILFPKTTANLIKEIIKKNSKRHVSLKKFNEEELSNLEHAKNPSDALKILQVISHKDQAYLEMKVLIHLEESKKEAQQNTINQAEELNDPHLSYDTLTCFKTFQTGGNATTLVDYHW